MTRHFKCALVTGASSGIGSAVARLLAQKGISLILTGRHQKRLEAIADELKESVDSLIVTDLEERSLIVEVIRKKVPDLIINNAGFGAYGEGIQIPIEEQLSMLEVNGAALLELTLEGARALIKAHKKGVIMNISSIAGEHPTPGMAVYGAVKSFVTMLSKALDVELKSKGIRVLVSCPGMVATDFANRAAKKRVNLASRPVMSAEFTAKQIWWQIEKKKGKHVFSRSYRFGSWVAKHLAPEWLVKRIIHRSTIKRL